MRAIVQRVKSASVEVDSTITGQVSQGLLIYLGIALDDSQQDIDYIVDKIANLRIFPDYQDKMNLSIKDTTNDILLISQFTLHADCRKGCRPSFTNSADSAIAEKLYNQTIEKLKITGLNVQTGIFAAKMLVKSTNDGPVTIMLDSKKLF